MFEKQEKQGTELTQSLRELTAAIVNLGRSPDQLATTVDAPKVCHPHHLLWEVYLWPLRMWGTLCNPVLLHLVVLVVVSGLRTRHRDLHTTGQYQGRDFSR